MAISVLAVSYATELAVIDSGVVPYCSTCADHQHTKIVTPTIKPWLSLFCDLLKVSDTHNASIILLGLAISALKVVCLADSK